MLYIFNCIGQSSRVMRAFFRLVYFQELSLRWLVRPVGLLLITLSLTLINKRNAIPSAQVNKRGQGCDVLRSDKWLKSLWDSTDTCSVWVPCRSSRCHVLHYISCVPIRLSLTMILCLFWLMLFAKWLTNILYVFYPWL